MARVMSITTPLGDGALLFYSMTATEALGRLFEYDITLLSPKPDLKAEDLLGKNVTVKLELLDGAERCFDAKVTRFGLTGGIGRYFRYQATGRPWAWAMTRSADCKIFQNMSVPDIVKDVFDKYAGTYELRLTGEHRPWEYCVQYRETDFNFVSRLMEQEGIYYYFTHEEGKHTLVLGDSYDAHETAPGGEKFVFLPQTVDTPRQKSEVVEEWFVSKQIQPGAYAITDYNFETPSTKLLETFKDARAHTDGKFEVFDYPGEYMVRAEGEQFVRTRLEELLAQHEVCEASGTTRTCKTGCLFKLTSHPRADQNREYLVTAAQYRLQFEGYEGIEDTGGDYRCSFTAQPSKVPFRPARSTPKPVVQGPQTGVVVGPAGDEIYTDKYGRVKVQFHWDRYGKKDENSSCWIRVSSPWAGSNWGAIHIPRIGQEVIVDFLEGDPDQPIITGRVYNGEQMPPWELPANKTQSGLLTRSSQKGAAANANAIRFEDKKGEEQLWIHAEKNQDIEVENDETHSVGHDRTKTIGNDETTHVKHDRTETVDNNETITIGVNRTESVGSNETISIGANRTVSVGASETIGIGSTQDVTVALAKTETIGAVYALTVGAAMNHAVGAALLQEVGGAKIVSVGAISTEEVGISKSIGAGTNISFDAGGKMAQKSGAAYSAEAGATMSFKSGGDYSVNSNAKAAVEAASELVLKCGSAELILKSSGEISIKGATISVTGSGKIVINASADLNLKGSKINQNS